MQNSPFTKDQADKIIGWGLEDPTTRGIVVFCFLLAIGALLWAFVLAPSRRKDKKDERDAKALEAEAARKNEIEVLERKERIETQRTTQVVALSTMVTDGRALSQNLVEALALAQARCKHQSPPDPLKT